MFESATLKNVALTMKILSIWRQYCFL